MSSYYTPLNSLLINVSNRDGNQGHCFDVEFQPGILGSICYLDDDVPKVRYMEGKETINLPSIPAIKKHHFDNLFETAFAHSKCYTPFESSYITKALMHPDVNFNDVRPLIRESYPSISHCSINKIVPKGYAFLLASKASLGCMTRVTYGGFDSYSCFLVPSLIVKFKLS